VAVRADHRSLHAQRLITTLGQTCEYELVVIPPWVMRDFGPRGARLEIESMQQQNQKPTEERDSRWGSFDKANALLEHPGSRYVLLCAEKKRVAVFPSYAFLLSCWHLPSAPAWLTRRWPPLRRGLSRRFINQTDVLNPNPGHVYSRRLQALIDKDRADTSGGYVGKIDWDVFVYG
jgi:hypothetical protein